MDKIPAVLIIDDPPINTSYVMRKQMDDAGILVEGHGFFAREYLSRWKEMEKSTIIPNSFWMKFIAWAIKEGVKGKCTLLPNPGGFGYLNESVKGYTKRELKKLIDIFKNEYTKNFDITPEIFTHTLAWDVANKKLLPKTEHEWMWKQNEKTLTEYMAGALKVLRDIGIVASGITQPCSFKGDFNMYARAVLNAEKIVNNITKTYYFHDSDGESLPLNSKIMINDKAKGEYVVSVVSAIKADEPFWYTLYGEGDIIKLADYFITEDGTSGRLINLLNANSPLVFHAHGQTLYSNGSELGFLCLQEVIKRMNRHIKDKVVWMKISEFAAWTINIK